MNRPIPHIRIVVAVSAFVMLGFAAVSIYSLGWSSDDVTKGNVIGTWINFAVLAVGFWIGSSSGGKAASTHETVATGKSDDPVHVMPEGEAP